MPGRRPVEQLVGRRQLLDRLGDLLGRALAGQRVTVLVSGEAGVGKTSLVRAVAAAAADQGARTGWGTCIDVDGAPGHWPWTQVLNGLVRAIGYDRARRLAGDDAALLATIVSTLGEAGSGEATDRTRLLLLDATTRFLDALAAERPVVVVLDDLQWADESSLVLFDFLARAPGSGVCLIGAYRHDELNAPARERLGALISHSEHLHVPGLDADAVHELVEGLLGRAVERSLTDVIHRRTGGHPFFVREVALLTGDDDGNVEHIPAAARDVIERRIGRLPGPTGEVLQVAAVIGTELFTDVVARALGTSTIAVEAAARDAVDAGVLARTGDGLRFTHDLLRETILDRLDAPRRIALHQAIGAALEHRASGAGRVSPPSELARHFIAAVALDGPRRAARWAMAAAAADSDALAFREAAAHLRRLRAAVADAAVDMDDDQLFDVLVAEADALARAGSTVDARGLLRAARDVAVRADDPDKTARVALATAHLGARFSSRRDEVVAELEGALAVVAGTDPVREAQLSAALARELQHSVAEDRPRAGPLSERALELGRRAGDPTTLAACLLARHDVLWTPGGEGERAEIAKEIVVVARAAGDDERHAEGLLLLANALLEQGSPAFEAALDACLALLDGLAQPRHRYVAETRRACVALLRGQLDEAAERVEKAAALGDRIREPDTGNVRMSQRLELVRARGRADELRSFAAEAVAHWTGAAIHAHAVAAGFCARAGDLEAARHHVEAVVDLGTWRADRSYLWSVFVRELAKAAVVLGDRGLCAHLLGDLRPLASSCGVNGAVVAFAGSHAHTAGLLAAALDQPDTSRELLEQACDTYRRLGATGWLADIRGDLATNSAVPAAPSASSMRRRGAVWQITFNGRSVTLAHTKGLADIARLLADPGADIHVLDLVGAADRSGRPGEVADRQALEAYRTRLADIDAEAEEATRHNDGERVARLDAERHALLDELGRTRDVHGRPRQFANHPGERARKAVMGRIRDAIRKLEPVLPDLAAHLQSTIVTGTYCRYRADRGTTWHVDERSGDSPTATTR